MWFGVVARASTPAPIVAKLRTEFNAVIASEGYAQALEKQFMEVMRVPPETSEQFLASRAQAVERRREGDGRLAGLSVIA